MHDHFDKIEYVRKARKLQHATQVVNERLNSSIKCSSSSRKEISVSTEAGMVQVLCYGFDVNTVQPVYFDMHGGGFIMGDAFQDDSINTELFAKAGCKVVSINYAKAPDFPYPVALNQISAVIRYFKDNCDKFNINPEVMAIGGHSAGGNLATATCSSGKFNFRGQILVYPPLDLATDPDDKPHCNGSIKPEMARIFNYCYADTADPKTPLVSPLFADAALLKNLPPALILLAGRDSLLEEGIRYGSKLSDAGVAVELHRYENAFHGFTYEQCAERNDAVVKMVNFLRRVFSPDATRRF